MIEKSKADMLFEKQQNIRQIEKQEDELMAEKKQIENGLFLLEKDLHRGFRQLEEINHDAFQQGNRLGSLTQQKYQEQERTFKQQLHQAQGEAEQTYTRERRRLQQAREEADEERRSLS
ncbi:hypothetical protein [Enterococcus faecalis]|uniref:hypothetical protein n=1 Tax=Enterococcus faecalis TaxID=1351 RepID=UPI001370D50E|nr:hypothetical protein [Enterococcus faecalis]NAA54086.1 hypothetical protein [Enterococcus faecalis]